MFINNTSKSFLKQEQTQHYWLHFTFIENILFKCFHLCIIDQTILELLIQFLIQRWMHNFQIMQKVGQGSFASVYKVKRKSDGSIYAMKKIKICKTNTKDITNCLNEVRILASINNPYIIGYKQAIYEQSQNCILLITEFAVNGDLSGYIKRHQKKKERIDQIEIWRLAIQMIYGLKALHRLNIFHRDIKSANILLTQNNSEIKLGDLNVSKISKSGLAVTQTGTPFYASPQVWSDLPYNGKCDVWSLGCVLYEMASFRPPFLATDIKMLKDKVSEGTYSRIPDQYSEDLQNFIRLCLTNNHKERPTADNLLRNIMIRKRLYMFPRQKFNELIYGELVNKENKLLQTIKIPRSNNFSSDLKLPKSNYKENLSDIVIKTQRKSSNNEEERLPQLIRRSSSRCQMKQQKVKHRLLYIR